LSAVIKLARGSRFTGRGGTGGAGGIGGARVAAGSTFFTETRGALGTLGSIVLNNDLHVRKSFFELRTCISNAGGRLRSIFNLSSFSLKGTRLPFTFLVTRSPRRFASFFKISIFIYITQYILFV
jgi:hypothetical protein